MSNELNIEETLDIIPRNWIPKQKCNLQSHALWQPQGVSSEYSDYSPEMQESQEVTEIQASYIKKKLIQHESSTCLQCEYSDCSSDLQPE